ncbi:hypothetical protein [Thermoanaerobacterium sp. RBIITD]|uniref:preprotein translocase subunit SecA n=1 Tax=Thermoanaerobacterium sp. RBIITD TaxID=1550240 RepID=UPI000BB79F57|nr:hypothetical protein [Thermoanaerobacterium sp. RBIITD]SNX54100.1 preprotein translocase subunit SecA [Thermoanaerobacterium sp. RBIITD]
MLYKFINKIRLKNIYRQIKKVEKYNVENMSNEDLKQAYKESQNIICKLAVVQEAVYRILKIRPYKEQLMCAYALYKGHIAEMPTGEGKTLVAAIVALLLNDIVHIVTVNDYLAKRDYILMKPLYDFFDVTVDYNCKNKNKKNLYANQVIYTSSSELIFDYLRNELKPVFQFPLNNVIIDEIDFVLLDNALSKFSIATSKYENINIKNFKIAKEIMPMFKCKEVSRRNFNNYVEEEDVHCVYSEYYGTAYFTEEGMKLIEKIFGKDTFYKNIDLYKALLATIEANLLFKNGKDYIIQDNQIVLINRANGRKMVNSKLDAQLHTAIEIKENVPVTLKNSLNYSMSYQVFFKKYKNMVGMSGTIYSAYKEFEELYKVPTVVIPSHNESKRIDYADLIFNTKKEKYEYLLYSLKYKRNKNQPILIITGNDEESNKVHEMLKNNNIHSNLLNSYTEDLEDEIIRKAGIHGAITVSTNMVGRGTDIKIDEETKKKNGLKLICLNRFLDKRIDDQVRGRTARQGDIGECIFYISLEDDIFNYMNSSEYKKFIKSIKTTKINITKILDKIQKDINLRNYKVRKINYILDFILEQQKLSIEAWKEYLKEKDMNFILKDVENKKIKKSVYNNYLSFGKELSTKLYLSLVDFIISEQYLLLRSDMEDIKHYLQYYNLSEKDAITEYERICNKQVDKFKDITLELIENHFATAKIDKIRWGG